MIWGEPEVEIAFRAPRAHEWQRYRFRIGEITARCTEPLPRDRELDFCVDSVRVSQEMTNDRWRLAQDIAPMIAAKLYEMFSQADTVKGFDRKQLEAAYQP